METEEEWRGVPDYPGYEVSNKGRVRSMDRIVKGRGGFPKRLKGKMMSQVRVGGSGPTGRYYACTLSQNGKQKSITIHTLVLEVFDRPRPEGYMGCHRDDNPVNNHLENLYWGTQRQNVADAVNSGRHKSVSEAMKTHCAQGHEYTPENTYIKPSSGHRDCRTCHRDQAREYGRKKRLKKQLNQPS